MAWTKTIGGQERKWGDPDPSQAFDMYTASQGQLAKEYGISGELSEFLPTYAEEYGQREEILGQRQDLLSRSTAFQTEGLYGSAEASGAGLMATTGTSLYDLSEQERSMSAQRGMKTGRRSGQAGNIYQQYMAGMQGAASQRAGGVQSLQFGVEEQELGFQEQQLGFESGFRSDLFDMMLRLKEREDE